MLPLVKLSKGAYKHESEEEWFFACWCKELLDKGVILEAYRPEPLTLRSALVFEHQVQLKTKMKDNIFTLVKASDYDGDMVIKWNPEYKGIFYLNLFDNCTVNPSPRGKYCKKNHLFYCITPHECVVDVKGTFTNSKQQSFSRTQQLLAALGHYVQKVVPLGKQGLFMKTFAPQEYLYTPVLKKKRVAFKSLDQFLANTKSILANEEIISS